MDSTTGAKRIEKLSQHLLLSEKKKEEEEEEEEGKARLERNDARSISEYAHDAFSIATKRVAMTEKHGGDLVANVLKAHGVEFIFCLSGGHISPILVSSKQQGIRIIDVRHEVNAVFAADAVGRLTGVPGVAAVTAGPGVTNTVTAIKNAAMAQSPLVLLGGAAATVMQSRGALQDIDQLAFLSPIVKWATSCRTARDIVPTLRKAFQIAASGVPGPVFVELPIDILYPVLELLPQGGTHSRVRARDVKECDLKQVLVPEEYQAKGMKAKEFVESKPPDSPVFLELKDGKKSPLPVQGVFRLLRAQLHAGAHDVDYDFSPLPVTYPKASGTEIGKAMAILSKAKKPLFLLGSQCMLHGPEGANKLKEACERLGVPCYLGGMARGLLGRNSRLHIRQNRGVSLQKADAIFMFGIVADFRLDYGRTLPSGVPIVAVNRSPDDLNLNQDLFWKPQVGVVGDPCDFVLSLLERQTTRAAPDFAEWAKELKTKDQAKEEANLEMSMKPALGRTSKEGVELINPLKICFDLEAVLEDESILVADGGDFVATCSYITRPRGPLTWLDPGAFGTLGVGGGFALGASLVAPEKQVYIIWGDGSCGYSLLEFDTFKRHGLNVIGIVGNDACWTQIEREQVPMFQDDAACVLDYLNYEQSAQGLGGKGVLIESPNQDAQALLREAQTMAKETKSPVLVNVLIGKTSFREGSLSV